MQAEVFYIYHQGEQRGPYTMKQVNHLYRSSFIDDDTLYWREGMEQWQPVTEIVQRKRQRKRLAFWGILLGVVAAISLVVWLFGDVTSSAWNEMTSGEYTEKSAWWRARGMVRTQLAPGEYVDFDDFTEDNVSLQEPDDAIVELGGTVHPSDRDAERRAWRVRLRYDRLRSAWVPAPVTTP